MLAIVDSVGVAIWLGDSVTTPGGAGVVTGLVENPGGAAPTSVVVTIAAVQFTYTGPQVTITSRATEQALPQIRSRPEW